MKRLVREAIKRVEAAAAANIGNSEIDLPLRPNDLRRVLDHIDSREEEVRLLRKCLRGVGRNAGLFSIGKPSQPDLAAIRLWVAVGLKARR